MSYKYRKYKRSLAHKILGILSDENLRESIFAETTANTGFYNEKRYRYQKVLWIRNKILGTSPYHNNEFEMFMQSLQLLESKQHVVRDTTDNGIEASFACTVKGEDAFLEEYYDVENRRDYLEMVELKTKWILPIISLLLSIAALLISYLKSK
jgi:hypothetical protein